MNWEIFLFETDRGEEPVKEFIKSQNPATIAKITHVLDLLEKFGSFLGMPHSKKMTAGLFELRIRGKQEIRIFYTIVKKNIYLLHAFQKQSQKTPSKEINIAKQRIKLLI